MASNCYGRVPATSKLALAAGWGATKLNEVWVPQGDGTWEARPTGFQPCNRAVHGARSVVVSGLTRTREVTGAKWRQVAPLLKKKKKKKPLLARTVPGQPHIPPPTGGDLLPYQAERRSLGFRFSATLQSETVSYHPSPCHNPCASLHNYAKLTACKGVELRKGCPALHENSCMSSKEALASACVCGPVRQPGRDRATHTMAVATIQGTRSAIRQPHASPSSWGS